MVFPLHNRDVLNPNLKIPFHRVVFFRCRSTDELVWDRLVQYYSFPNVF